MKQSTEKSALPQAAPSLRIERYRPAIDAAISNCIERGAYIGGELVQGFENQLADYLNCDNVVSCNSCTDALFLSLRSLGIGKGDEVIVPSLTAAGTAVAVTQCGATPRFSDVNKVSRNIDLASIQAAMSPKVKAIIVVHLHGNPVDLDPIIQFANQLSLPVIEDCAQAIGATYNGRPVGTIGTIGAFSFYPTKNLGGVGDGGAIATNDASLADAIRAATNYGWDANRECVREGVNSRLDALQAVILSALLPELDSGNSERVVAAEKYENALAGSPIRPAPKNEGAVFHQYAVETETRQELADYLAELGIYTARHYGKGLHEEPFFGKFLPENAEFPNTEYLTRRMLSLPIQSELMTEQPRIIKALKGFQIT